MDIIIPKHMGQVFSHKKKITPGVFHKAVAHENRTAARQDQGQLTFFVIMKGFIESRKIPIFYPNGFFILSGDLKVYRFHDKVIQDLLQI
jgi:hypothetical protein